MRLLIVTPALGTTLGGGERYALDVVLELAQAGHELTVVTSTARQEADFWQGSEPAPTAEAQAWPFRSYHLPIPPFPGGQAALFRRRKLLALTDWLPAGLNPFAPYNALFPHLPDLPALLADLKPDFDLVHGFNLSWESPLLAAAAYARRHQLPLVITPFAHPGSRSARWNLQRREQRELLASAARLLALSSSEKAGLTSWGIAPECIDLIGMGYTPYPAAAAAPDPALPAHYALFVGRASRDKGSFEAINAISTLAPSTELHLVLAGHVDADVAAHIAGLSPAQRARIHTLGRVSEARKHQLLAGAFVFLLPSRSDAFGIVILEAWQHGVPVIGARSGGIPGVIDDRTNGLLVPYGDSQALAQALTQLLNTPDFARQLG
ncbi:MAG: glycosyltransferase family 4 protein, partial [Anaerolineales bacterium]|nr:glycosyltransferase family 4 protein [Anaerolineales bacterium]